MPKGNLYNGSALWDAVVHLANRLFTDTPGRPVRRGIPTRGKPVFEYLEELDTWSGSDLLICTDTDPDPTYDGGGTYARIGYSDAGALTFTLEDDGGTIPLVNSTTYATRIIDELDSTAEAGRALFTFRLEVDGAATLTGGALLIRGIGHSTFHGLREWNYLWNYGYDPVIVGRFHVNGHSGNLFRLGWPTYTDATYGFYLDDGTELSATYALTAGDVIHCFGQDIYTAALDSITDD